MHLHRLERNLLAELKWAVMSQCAAFFEAVSKCKWKIGMTKKNGGGHS